MLPALHLFFAGQKKGADHLATKEGLEDVLLPTGSDKRASPSCCDHFCSPDLALHSTGSDLTLDVPGHAFYFRRYFRYSVNGPGIGVCLRIAVIQPDHIRQTDEHIGFDEIGYQSA